MANRLVPALASYVPVASQLVLAVQPPSYVTNGSTFSVTVQAGDAFGDPAPSFNGNVTVSLVSNPGGATLGGQLTEPAVKGVATFPDLTIDNPGDGYTLLFQATLNGHLKSVLSQSFNVVDDLVVITSADTNQPGSLRYAVAQADADAALGQSDTITFAPTLNGAFITLFSGALELTAGSGTTTIDGGGRVSVSSYYASAVIQVDSGANAVLTGLTLEEGGDFFASDSGAIANAGSLSVSNCTLYYNTNGIVNTGTLTVADCNLSYNTDGINNFGTVILANSTLSGNFTAIDNAASLTVSNTTVVYSYYYSIYNAPGAEATLSNSTISGNFGTLANNGADGEQLHHRRQLRRRHRYRRPPDPAKLDPVRELSRGHFGQHQQRQRLQPPGHGRREQHE